MSLQNLAALLLLAALFGASFPLIRVTAPIFGPFFLVEVRLLLAAAILALYALAVGHHFKFGTLWKDWLVLGFVNVALPFALVAIATLHLTASLTAILVSTIPMFTAVVAMMWMKTPLTAKKLGGLALGVVGVAILSGWSPIALTTMTLLSILAVLLAALCYGIGNVYIKQRFEGVPVLTLMVGNFLTAAFLLAPLALATPPAQLPSTTAMLVLAALVLLSTVFAYMLFFKLIALIGPTSTSSVAYIVPLFGTFFGAVFLAEPVNTGMLLGLVIILASVSLVTNLQVGRRSAVLP